VSHLPQVWIQQAEQLIHRAGLTTTHGRQQHHHLRAGSLRFNGGIKRIH
jgi:hypothetical protein